MVISHLLTNEFATIIKAFLLLELVTSQGNSTWNGYTKAALENTFGS